MRRLFNICQNLIFVEKRLESKEVTSLCLLSPSSKMYEVLLIGFTFMYVIILCAVFRPLAILYFPGINPSLLYREI